MKLTEQYGGHTFGHSWKMLKIGTRKNGLPYSVVLPTNPEWSSVRIKKKKERTSTLLHCKATFMASQSIQTCFLPHRYRGIERNTCSTWAALPTTNQSLRTWSVGRRFESKRHKTSLFLVSSESARIVIATAYDRLERTR